MKKVVIIEARRTAIGSFNGSLSSLKATELGSLVIKSVVERSGIQSNQVDEVIMGNVLSCGLGQAPARQAALYAGLPNKTECLTINKMCGSGLKSVMLAHQAIQCGDADVIIAGGMESMTNAPYILAQARNGYRLGNNKILDSIILDGLWDVYNDIHMGSCAESCAKDLKLTREEVDNFATNSYKKAISAQENNHFKNEIVPVEIKSKTDTKLISEDEEPRKVNFEKIPKLKPAFDKDGIVTAANASKINDGAAALLVMSEEFALSNGFVPKVEIVAQASAAKAPIDFPIAPVDAITKVLKKSGLAKEDIDLFEINEAFAVVSLAANKLLNLNEAKVDIFGGAIALGHPIGASGARILVTLLNQMALTNSKFGLCALCIGGGEASALIVKKYT